MHRVDEPMPDSKWRLHSPTPHLLNNNLCPSASEKAAVLEGVSTARSRLVWLSIERDRLAQYLRNYHPFLRQNWPDICFFKPCPDAMAKKAMICKVESELLAVQESVHAHTFVLAPIRMLPPELLSEIFFWCLPFIDFNHPWYDSRKSFQKGTYGVPALYPPMIPLLLARICRTWRSLALDTSELWKNIVLNEEYRVNYADLTMPELWIKRAQACPSMSFRWRLYDESQRGNADNRKIFDILQAHSHRWETLHIIADYEQALSPFFAEDIPYFGSLNWLEVEVMGREDLSWLLSCLAHPERSPNLGHLTLSCSEEWLWEELAEFNHPSLITLFINKGKIPPQEAVGLLGNCPAVDMVTLEIGGMDAYWEPWYFPGGPARNIVVHAALKDLELTSLNDAEFYLFFEMATLPQLISLVLHCPYHLLGSTQLLEFLSRSSCQLKNLRISGEDGTRSGHPSETPISSIITFLCHQSVANSLESFDYLNFEESGVPLVEFLTLKPGHVSLPLLRRIEELALEVATTDDIDKVVDMLQSRFKPPPGTRSADGIVALALEEAAIFLTVVETSAKDVSKLRLLQKEGYSLKFKVVFNDDEPSDDSEEEWE